jgi:hypothetical protein
MKEKLAKLVKAIYVGVVGYAVVKVVKTDTVQEKLFEVLGEDKFLSIQSMVRLALDVLAWPVHFVRGLLP